MKKTFQNTVVLSSLFLSSLAVAGIDIPHVHDYDRALGEANWEKVKADSVPAHLLTRSQIDSPTGAYSRLFPKSFLQEELLTVCHRDCKNRDLIKVKNGAIEAKDKDALEQANVYFWLRRYFGFVDERFNFKFSKRLRVMTNRGLKDPTAGKKMKNNAFFNPADVTLSFLPATNNWLANAMNGKLNRSGFDPSVIAHEASHYFFHHLFPVSVNYEINGLNEGFADYVANLQLNNPKVGLVMLRGKALRDSSSLVDGQNKPKIYQPGLESHDLGERVALVLWKTRALADNKEEFDRQVIEAISAISENPYASIQTFKAEMMKRIGTAVPSSRLAEARVIWQISLDAPEKSVSDLSFLSKSTNVAPYFGFRGRETISPDFADEMGMDTESNTGFAFLREEKLSGGQTAYLMKEDKSGAEPYWYVIDSASNLILGIYDSRGELVMNKSILKDIDGLTSKAASQNSAITEFVKKIRLATETVQGKGDLLSAYKLNGTQTTVETLNFNGSNISVTRVEVGLKKKLLQNLLFGLPDLNKISVITADLNIAALPTLNEKRVIGYKMSFKNGTSMEMILNHYGPQQK